MTIQSTFPTAFTAKNSKALLASLGALACLLTVVVYLPGMKAGFYLDDQSNILWVPALHWSEWSIGGLVDALINTRMPTRPLANLTFALNHLAGGLDPAGYHWTNLAIHLAMGLTLWWVAFLVAQESSPQSVTRSRIILSSFAVALLFLVHPLNIQAVTYVVQRMTSMASLFVLLSLGCYISARRTQGWHARIGYVGSAFCWLLAMASKEVAIQLPLVLLLYEACFHRDYWRSRLRRAGRQVDWLRCTVMAAPLLAILVGVLAHMYGSSGLLRWDEQFPGRDFTGVERLLTEARVQFFYLSLVLWPAPSRLNLEHDFILSKSFWTPWTTGVSVIGWLLLLVAVILIARRYPRYGFPLLAYAAFHLLESAPIGIEPIFEHRMYLPMAFLAMFMNSVLLSGALRSRVALGGVLLLVIPLSFATYERNLTWSDKLAFLRDCAEKSPQKFRPWYNLGSQLGREGQYAEAEKALIWALKLQPHRTRPNLAEAHNQLGNVYLLTGRKAMAIEQYRLALERDPSLHTAQMNLGSALRGRIIDAQ